MMAEIEPSNGSDPRLGELERIGISQWILDLADELGVDAALTIWRRLSHESGEDHRVSVPRWSTYLRFQRNHFIASLDAQGHPPEVIRELLVTALCESLSLVSIKRIVSRLRSEQG